MKSVKRNKKREDQKERGMLKEVRKYYPMTDHMRLLKRRLDTLGSFQSKFLNPGFFSKKPTTTEVIKYLDAVSDAGSNYWNHVYKAYPELLGKSLSSNNTEISVTD